MKLVANIFNWLKIGCSLFFFLIFLLIGIIFFTLNEGVYFPLGTIFMLTSLLFVPSIVVCYISNQRLKIIKTQKELLPISIITLILGDLVSGIMMLIMKDEDLANG